MALKFLKSILAVSKFDDEKNRLAVLINTIAVLVIIGLCIVTLQRVFFDKFNFVPATVAVIAILITAIFLTMHGKISMGASLVIYSVYALMVYLAWTNDGLHDFAFMGMIGLLVVAGLILHKKYFYILVTVCVITVLLFAIFEMKGILVNRFSHTTVLLDVIDMIIVVLLTAAAIRVFSERLIKSLTLARNNEKAIKESEDRNKALISALPDLVMTISADGEMRNFTIPNFFPRTHTKEEILNKNISEALPPDIAKRAFEAIERAIEFKRVEQFEYQLMAQGKLCDFEARFSPLNKNEIIVVIRDISERKRAEIALKINEQMFESFMEYSPIYVFFKDQEIRSLRLSRNFEKMLHMPVEDILGKTMYELFPSELAKRMVEDDLRILQKGEIVRVVEELEGRFYETIKFPITIEEKPQYLAGFTIDITENKRNEIRLKKYAKELKEANKSKERLFSIIAHDLRSPFLGILGSIQMLSSDYNILTEDEKKTLIERIGSSIRKTFELLENLLHWSRMQSGKITPVPVMLNLEQEIFPVVKLLKDIALQKNVDIVCDINPAYEAYTDKDMLKTIVRNLISNAVKFSIAGGVIAIKSYENNGNFVVQISDAGIGMDKEILESLFKKENVKSRLGTANEMGTGLGLLVCKEMIELNNGEIWAESREGTGSTFYFTMPKVKV